MVKQFLLYTFLTCVFIRAQELPPVQNFPPSEYGAENQNWGIAQTPDKLIYVANNKGLLEFNGAEWTLFPSPNETIIRSVKVVGNRIYTGCYKEFGYWTATDFGTLEYTSLSKKIIEDLLEDEEFWNIDAAEDVILFQSKKRIYSYDLQTDTVKIISATSSLPRIFNVDGTIYFQKSNKGIFKIQSGEEVPYNETETLRSDEIINMFKKGNDLVVLTRNQGFYKLVGGETLVKWRIGTEELLVENSIYSALQLKDNGYALGTISDGIIILDGNGELRYHIDQIKGLRNNTILSLFEDIDHNLWLGLDNGISYINLKSPYRVYLDNQGTIGSVYTSSLWDGHRYLGTNQGLFCKKIEGEEAFEFIEGTQGQVWSLNIMEGTLFCGHHTGTFVVNKKRADKIANIPGTWKIESMENRPNLALQGNYNGLYVLERFNGTWKIRNKVAGFDYSSRYFEVLDQDVFVNHEYKGVFRVNIDPAFTKVLNVAIDTLTPGFNSGIIKHKGELLYAHKNGVLRYDHQSGKFLKDSILSNVYATTEYVSGKMVIDDQSRGLWFFSKDNISRVVSGQLSNRPTIEHIPLQESLRDGIVGYENISAWNTDGTYMLGTSMGYMTLNLNAIPEKEFEVNIGKINQATKNTSTLDMGLVGKNEVGNFKNDQNTLAISFYTPYYNKYETPSYQFQLSDRYPNWSQWTQASSVTFENLPHGDYTFNVRSKVGNKVSENRATYSFTIERPWHLSHTAIILYIICGLAGSLAIHHTYKRVYHKRQQKLIEKNRKDMELEKARNEKEIIKIKNEQLQKEFKGKSNELAASTLSIIRKNELLTQVKHQLVSTTKPEGFVKPIVEMIDKNLNQNDDWELFKEAFNNADRKFLKKLKKAHPNLSPNDIRLCAYLRLNLTSKEIAPLFNISPRSVEVKRYRLRKKMGLEHDENLVDYILDL